MIEDKLRLPVGTSLQLQQEDVANPVRYIVKLLGYYPGKGLIVTNTEVNGRTVLLTDQTRLVVRGLQGIVCQGFRVKVLQTSMIPYPHLHLSYPDEIEISVVRDAARITTRQPALVHNTKNTTGRNHEAMVLDLSASGAKVATRVPVANLDEVLEVKMSLDVAKYEEHLKVLAVVKKISFQDGDKHKGRLPLHYYGLMFQGVNHLQKLILHAYVLECSVKVEI